MDNPPLSFDAAALDPLTAAVCTLCDIRRMCAEMLDAERKWLPQFEGKRIRPAMPIEIPTGCVPAEVPVDPALAINRRFATLIQQAESS